MAANDKSSSAGLIGLTFHSALADESPLYPEAFMDDLFGRLSFPDSKLFCLGNPQGPKHWMKERWIDGGLADTYLQFELYDNPSLHDDVIAAYEKAYSGVFYRRNILGEWSAAEGLIWPAWTDAPAAATDQDQGQNRRGRRYRALAHGLRRAGGDSAQALALPHRAPDGQRLHLR